MADTIIRREMSDSEKKVLEIFKSVSKNSFYAVAATNMIAILAM